MSLCRPTFYGTNTEKWTLYLSNQLRKIRLHLRNMLVCFVLEYYYETSQDSDTH